MPQKQFNEALELLALRDDLLELLSREVVSITFINADGDYRTMESTLLDSAFDEPQPENMNEEFITVWSTEAEAWRRVRIDSVQEYEVV